VLKVSKTFYTNLNSFIKRYLNSSLADAQHYSAFNTQKPNEEIILYFKYLHPEFHKLFKDNQNQESENKIINCKISLHLFTNQESE
jgi:hypothetical protein